MLFFTKKTKIVVDCFTYVDVAYEFFKIRKAIRYYPEIIKKMDPWVTKDVPRDPKTNIEINTPTIKQCTGINELYKHGAIIPMWTDIKFSPKTHLEGKSALAMTEPWYADKLHEHPRQQFVGILNDYTHIKFIGIWNLQEKRGVKFLWNSAFWNLNNLNRDIIIPPGVSFYDWQCQTNVNAMVRNDADPFTLSAGTPLIHITPLTENEVEYKCHLVDHHDWMKKNQVSVLYPNFIPGRRWARFWKDKAALDRMDAEDAAEKRKCPFGFGK